MEPYQEADTATRNSGSNALNALKYAGGAALGTAGLGIAGKFMNKVLPLLSPLVPESFAKKALSKIDPRLGTFINKAESEGSDFSETRDFLQQTADKTLAQADEKKKNIIQKHSPELHDFIKEKIGGGTGLIAAATQANTDPKFRSVIEKIVKENKTSWPELVDMIYGSVGEKDNARVGSLKKFNENKKGFLQRETERFESGYGSKGTPQQQTQTPEAASQSQQGQVGPGQTELMGILQKINQRLR